MEQLTYALPDIHSSVDVEICVFNCMRKVRQPDGDEPVTPCPACDLAQIRVSHALSISALAFPFKAREIMNADFVRLYIFPEVRVAGGATLINPKPKPLIPG